MLDGVLADHLDAPDLEFTWVGDDAVDPLQQAQTLSILVNAGIKTREEARADLGLTGEGAGAPGAADALGKFNPHHDDRGRFTFAPGGAQSSRPTEGQVDGTERSSPPQDQRAAEPSGSPGEHDVGNSTPIVVAQDLSQSCANYIAANRQARILRVFPGQVLTQSLQDVISAAKQGDAAAKRACKLLFDNRFMK